MLTTRIIVLGLNVAALGLALHAVPATGPLRADDRDQRDQLVEAEKQRRAAYIRTMQHIAASFKVLRLSKDGEVPCDMVQESVLNWDDQARHPNVIYPGTTWIWHHNGQPQAIVEIYNNWGVVGEWILFLCSFSSDRLVFDDGSAKWMPPQSHSGPQEIPAAPDAAHTDAARTLQLKDLSRRFASHQFWDQGRFTLRLLPQAIYRYKDEPAGILDGAMYAFVHGTNPEVLMLIEAHRTAEGRACWKVGFGAVAAAKCIVHLDGKEFWSCQPYDAAASDPRGILLKTLPVMDADLSEAAAP